MSFFIEPIHVLRCERRRAKNLASRQSSNQNLQLEIYQRVSTAALSFDVLVWKYIYCRMNKAIDSLEENIIAGEGFRGRSIRNRAIVMVTVLLVG